MSLRALWKGVITFAEHKVPVKLFAALEDRTVHFRLLHRSDKQPVSQKMVNSETDREMPGEQRVKGVERENDRVVLLNEKELLKLEPESSRTIAVNRFIPVRSLGHQWYDRPYYLGPDGDNTAYWSLLTALGNGEVEGIARWTMRKKEYVGALRAEPSCLVLITLRFAHRIISPSLVQLPEFRAFEEQEVRMAEKLVAMMSGDFKPENYRDEYRKKLLGLIENKQKGIRMEIGKPRPEKEEPSSLSRALESSLAALEEKADD